uniref:Uncharacterized protein n=1 Tax=Anguilla anguilla TaxID=7936 RepID=A0A0E9U132_ANGAN
MRTHTHTHTHLKLLLSPEISCSYKAEDRRRNT